MSKPDADNLSHLILKDLNQLSLMIDGWTKTTSEGLTTVAQDDAKKILASIASKLGELRALDEEN